jgi:tetratricopeptide (TPR) repeat protein
MDHLSGKLRRRSIELGNCRGTGSVSSTTSGHVVDHLHDLLTEAHRARNKGRDRRAIGLYKRILLEDSHNPDVALRVAPMLARRGDGFEAWQLYRRAARDFAKAKRWDECLSVYREACRVLPFEFEAWRLCAELLLKMGREDVALQVLLDGRMHFRGPVGHAQAIALLTRARSIEPWDAHVVLDLARLYGRSDLPEVALELLSCLALRAQGADLRKVRALQWRLTLGFRFAWLWLRAWGSSPDDAAAFEKFA